ncbi:MAG: hypothetical protein RLZZ481_343 [Pseudomonadota bacterium]
MVESAKVPAPNWRDSWLFTVTASDLYAFTTDDHASARRAVLVSIKVAQADYGESDYRAFD